MSTVTGFKTLIKSNPVGLYLVNLRKRFLYQHYAKRYSDKEFVTRLYEKNLEKPLNLDNPELFTEKIQWLKLYYRDERIPICSDKYEAKKYIAQLGHEDLLIPTLAVYDSVDELDLAALPKQFIIKATHGSGWNVLCKDKDAMNWRIIKKTMNVWMHQNLYIYGREWNYQYQTPRLIVEPLMDDKPLVDYKFFCFNGKAKTVQANYYVDGKKHLDFYDNDWHKIENVQDKDCLGTGEVLPMPDCFLEMKRLADELAAPFPFVRVDFYNVHGEIYFGEMTFFPASGLYRFTLPEADKLLGDWLTLPEKNHEA